MSAETRQEIASAATGAEGVNCTPYFRQSPKPGDASVRLASRVRPQNGFGYVDTWQVWVALSQDLAQAERWIDQYLDGLLAALDRPLFFRGVQSVTPSELLWGGIGGPVINGLILEGAREG